MRGCSSVKRSSSNRNGQLWFGFYLFGLKWEVRLLPRGHKILKDGKQECVGLCCLNERLIYIAADQSNEQRRLTFAHELQHAIEDQADVDYEEGVSVEVHDRWTDQVARGWVYMMRHNPQIIEFLQGGKD